MSKRFLIVLAVVILGFGGLYLVGKSNKAAAPGSTSSSNAQPTTHLFGSGKKNVTLIEYGDYQCPACGAYYPLVKAVVEKYKDDIYLQFRNYPLVTIHQNAFAGSRAAEAADMQGKYWEMHDLLYEQQRTWSASNSPKTYFDQYATELKLDLKKFDDDYSSSTVNDRIAADIKEGQKIGADSTPTFVLDGKKLDQNPKDQASFEKLITDAIAAKK